MPRHFPERMRRREYLGTVGAVLGATALAGCSGGGNVDGEVVVDETVFGEGSTYRFDAEQGNTINIYAENKEGQSVAFSLANPEGTEIFDETVATDDTFSHTVEVGGSFSITVLPVGSAGAESSIEVGVES